MLGLVVCFCLWVCSGLLGLCCFRGVLRVLEWWGSWLHLAFMVCYLCLVYFLIFWYFNYYFLLFVLPVGFAGFGVFILGVFGWGF